MYLNKLKYIVRSHEAQKDGFSVAHDGRVITIFSAPNYCGIYNNRAAFLRFTKTPKDGNIDHLLSCLLALSALTFTRIISLVGNSEELVNTFSIHQFHEACKKLPATIVKKV